MIPCFCFAQILRSPVVKLENRVSIRGAGRRPSDQEQQIKDRTRYPAFSSWNDISCFVLFRRLIECVMLAVKQIVARFRLILSGQIFMMTVLFFCKKMTFFSNIVLNFQGTPVQNNVLELWSL